MSKSKKKPAVITDTPSTGKHQCAPPTITHHASMQNKTRVGLFIMMALVKFGNGVAEMSGKVDGTVFSRNAYGAIARGWKKPIFPRTTAQMAVNASFGTQSQVWRTLSPSVQAGWNSLASTIAFVNRIGSTIYLTGQAMFNKLNQSLVSAGQSAITAAPAYTIPAAPLTLSGAAAAGAATFTAIFTPTPVPAGVVFQIWATPQISAGRISVKRQYKLLANIAAAGASPSNIKAAYVAKFGALVATNAIYLQMRAVSVTTGVASPFIQAAVIVAA